MTSESTLNSALLSSAKMMKVPSRSPSAKLLQHLLALQMHNVLLEARVISAEFLLAASPKRDPPKAHEDVAFCSIQLSP